MPSDSSHVGLSRTWPWWVAAIAWFVLTSLGHLQFSLWLVSARDGPFGPYQLSDFVPFAAVVGLFGLVAYLYRQLRACEQPVRFVAWWAVWFACVVAIDRHLTFSSNELAHYPQYALLAWLLAHALDPGKGRWVAGRIMFWTALLGMVDEFQQYVWIAPTYSLHLDFNDFLVNLVAAAAGMMMYYGAHLGHVLPEKATTNYRRPLVEIFISGALLVSSAWILATDRISTMPEMTVPPGGLVSSEKSGLRLYLEREAGTLGSVSIGPRHGTYLILDPLQALTLMTLFGLAYGRYPKSPWEWSRRDRATH